MEEIFGREKTLPLRVKFGQHEELLEFLVIESVHVPVILGKDWLKRNNPQIDWSKNTMKIPTKVTDSTGKRIRFRAFEDVSSHFLQLGIAKNAPHTIEIEEASKIRTAEAHSQQPSGVEPLQNPQQHQHEGQHQKFEDAKKVRDPSERSLSSMGETRPSQNSEDSKLTRNP